MRSKPGCEISIPNRPMAKSGLGIWLEAVCPIYRRKRFIADVPQASASFAVAGRIRRGMEMAGLDMGFHRLPNQDTRSLRPP